MNDKTKADRSKQLNETLSQIEKQFGKGTVMKMGEREVIDIPAVSTGSLGLDIALGIGGLPKDYNLQGKFDQKAERIGRMVAPLMMKNLASNIYEKVLKRTK